MNIVCSTEVSFLALFLTFQFVVLFAFGSTSFFFDTLLVPFIPGRLFLDGVSIQQRRNRRFRRGKTKKRGQTSRTLSREREEEECFCSHSLFCFFFSAQLSSLFGCLCFSCFFGDSLSLYAPSFSLSFV
jgi:hypothetical protein